MTTNEFFGDDPVDGTAGAPDRLDRLAYSHHVVNLLDRVRRQSESSVLSVVGSWGSGKSSVLAMAMRLLRQRTDEPRWRVAEFNPWTYSDLESLQFGFFTSLREALPDKKKWSEARRNIGDFGAAISPMGKATALLGLDSSGLISAMSKAVGGDVSAAATKAKAESALRGAGQPILMVLDDLDRLTPDELLLVLKLVRLVGRLPNVYYVLSYDERTLLDVLMRTDLIGSSDEGRARDYLEKITQIRLDIPTLRDKQAIDLFDTALTAVLTRNQIGLGPDETHRLSRAYYLHLRQRLATPRSINRFVAQLDAFHSVVSNEVDFIDFLLVTWIRTAESGVYGLIRRYKDELTNSGDPFTRLTNRTTPADIKTRWLGLLRAEGVAEVNIDGVLGLLSLMFLPVRGAVENTTYSNDFYTELRRRQGIGHVDYFDRYFTFGIPAEDIADSTVLEALTMLRTDTSGPALERLVTGLIEDNDRVARKLESEHQLGNVPAAPLLRVFSKVYSHLPAAISFVSDSRRNIQFLAEQLIFDVSPADGPNLLRSMSQTDGGLVLAAAIIDRLHHRTSQEDGPASSRLGWHAEAQATVLALISNRLQRESATPLPEIAEDLLSLIWPWKRLDQASLAEWLNSQVSDGNWRLADTLGLFVQTGVSAGDGPQRTTVGDFEFGPAGDLFGIDFLIDKLKDEIAVLEPEINRYLLDASWENRRKVALAALRAERDRRATGITPDYEDAAE